MKFAKRPHQPGARPAKHREARAGQLGAGGQVEDAERGGQVPVGFGGEVEQGRLAPRAHHPVGGGVAVGRAVGRKVRHRERATLQLGLHLAQTAVERLHLLARRLELRDQLVGRLLGALPPHHLFVRGVALGLERLHPDEDVPPLAVEREQRVERLVDGGIETAEEGGATALGILAQALEIDHRSASGRGGRARGRGNRN